MARAKRKSDNPHVSTLASLSGLFHMEIAAARVVLRRAGVKPVELERAESGVLVRESYSTVDATAALSEYRKKWPHMTTDPEVSAEVAAVRAEAFAAKAKEHATGQPKQATIDEGLVTSAVDTMPPPKAVPEADLGAIVNTLAMIGEATELKATELIGAVKSIEAAIGDLASELAKIRASFDAWNTPNTTGKC